MTSEANGIALIDITDWRTGADREVAHRLVGAFRDTGFACVTGHGVPPDAVAGVFDAARRLFGLDNTRLAALHHSHARNFRGHVPLGEAPGPGAGYEVFDIGLELPDTYRGPGDTLRATPNLWPEMDGFRSQVLDYLGSVRRLADCVLSAIAVELGGSPDFFACRSREPHGQLRLLHYPRQPLAPEDALSVGRHSDYEALTVLAQDSVGGLQVRRPDGSWRDIQPVEGAFVLNVGEMLMRWTNGLLPATPHRVLSPRSRDRYSVAFFYAASYDTVIEPIGPLARPGQDPSYESVTVGEYLQRRFTEVGN
ncbi:2OG-Fe(II) oxygenase family protein [Streptomyces sp. BK205]|uniref:isopenicillin N synthase family dioxygenase n=1 Tax=Streptomyces sp. BK205 TaxID=2512164 RepID=UPI001043F2DB|nr:2OG-Fe(II) oxygenase family protein [Streptomyces sp. BK205]TCR16049.1 isopenicillin N synthase-like dioxygenase [Streptomyces sp. BK205]